MPSKRAFAPVDYHSPFEVAITGHVLKVVVITSIAPLPVWTAKWKRNVGGWVRGGLRGRRQESGLASRPCL
jgi:hypothetical protein